MNDPITLVTIHQLLVRAHDAYKPHGDTDTSFELAAICSNVATELRIAAGEKPLDRTVIKYLRSISDEV